MRLFALTSGATLAILGFVGLLGGWSSGSWVGDGLLYLLAGVLFIYVGSTDWSPEQLRYIIGGVGILYLLSGGVAIIALFAFDLTVAISDMVRLAVGAVFVLGVLALTCEEGPSGGR